VISLQSFRDDGISHKRDVEKLIRGQLQPEEQNCTHFMRPERVTVITEALKRLITKESFLGFY